MGIVLEKKVEQQDGVFYRYAIGKIKFWFVQQNNTGDIYCVYTSIEDKEYSNDFEIRIYNDRNDTFYPIQFRMEVRSQDILTSAVDGLVEKIKYISSVVDAIQNFFETSEHRQKYKGKISC